MVGSCVTRRWRCGCTTAGRPRDVGGGWCDVGGGTQVRVGMVRVVTSGCFLLLAGGDRAGATHFEPEYSSNEAGHGPGSDQTDDVRTAGAAHFGRAFSSDEAGDGPGSYCEGDDEDELDCSQASLPEAAAWEVGLEVSMLSKEEDINKMSAALYESKREELKRSALRLGGETGERPRRMARAGGSAGSLSSGLRQSGSPSSASSAGGKWPWTFHGHGTTLELSDEEEEEEEEELVTVQGEPKPLSEVTEEDQERMTKAEHERYFELMMS
uniref:Transcription factor TFIIE alpha subunit C-terminal domain-containing protein n=1 Tax=Haptolina ericina TaxID=156174 RepID=A0A7S3C5H0_9EUKA|mmetsp:Transcript_7645/g.17096  ORF Transcript_7645/g.17096 Transcript_7645/m.17096 type:complete len:269 (+) Transcript_7645:493-1299(+)